MSGQTPRRNDFFQSSPFTRPSLSTQLRFRSYSQYQGYNSHATHDSAMRAIWAIVGINTAVFGAWQYAKATRDNRLLTLFHNNATCSYDNIEAARYYTLVTSAFMHQDPTHFLFNMFSLYAFGSLLSWIPGVGAAHVIGVTIGSAIAGSVAWLYQQKLPNKSDTSLRMGSLLQRKRINSYAIGASGSVMGLAGAATCLMPFAPMQLLLIPVTFPLWLMSLGYVGVDIFYIGANDSIGHSAHLGGVAFGALYYFLYLRRFGGVWNMLRMGSRR